MINSAEILDKLKRIRADHQPVVIAGVGCGLTARAAASGGADLLAVYSTAIYRIQGLPAALSFLPYDNANDITFSASAAVMANAGDVPVLFGLGVHDPRTTPEKLVNMALSLGAVGVLNEPFVGMYGHQLSNELEKSGFGFSREVELIQNAVHRGLITLGWVFNQEEAMRMVDVGTHILGIILAITRDESGDDDQSILVDDAIQRIDSIVTNVKRIRDDIIILGHGGPLNSPAVVGEVMERTHIDGIFTGSTGERFPIENGVADAVRQYKKMLG